MCIRDRHNYVVHAEANAVLNYRGSLKDLEGSTVYVTLFPCHDCAKILAQVGVGEVVYLDNKYADTDDGRIDVYKRQAAGTISTLSIPLRRLSVSQPVAERTPIPR